MTGGRCFPGKIFSCGRGRGRIMRTHAIRAMHTRNTPAQCTRMTHPHDVPAHDTRDAKARHTRAPEGGGDGDDGGAAILSQLR